MTIVCKSIGCGTAAVFQHDFCEACATKRHDNNNGDDGSMSDRYPQYFKPLGDLTEIDVYAVHHLFQIQDPSGCIQHASKKLLLAGVRTGGKGAFKDIQEARDTLSRWLQLNQETSQP